MVGIRNWLVKPGCWNYFKLITANWSSFTLQNSATVRKVTPKLLLWLSILTARPAKLQLKNGEWCCTWSCNFFTSSTFSRTAIYWTALKTFTRKGSLFSVVIFEDWTPTHTFMLCMCLHKHLSKAIFISQQNTPVSCPYTLGMTAEGTGTQPKPSLLQGLNNNSWWIPGRGTGRLTLTTSKNNTSWRKASQHVEEKKKKKITRPDYFEESLNSYIKKDQRLLSKSQNHAMMLQWKHPASWMWGEGTRWQLSRLWKPKQ